MAKQPTELHLAILEDGEAMNVISLNRLIDVLDVPKLIYLNGLVANRLIDAISTTEESK
jgi:hypothetical protein